MAHFAYVVDGVVEKVHVVVNEVITDDDGVEQEAWGQAFLADLHGLPAENFIQCSYNANARANYPSRGFIYDTDLDAFIPPKPFASWVLNDAFLWEAPIPYPTKGDWVWDEDSGVWVKA